MINCLDQKVRKLIFFLLACMFAFIALAVNYSLYQGAVKQEKTGLRETTVDTGLENMLDPMFSKTELGGFTFASVQIPRKGEEDFAPKLCVNQIPGMADTTLVKYAERIQQTKGRDEIRLPGLFYIIKRKQNVGKAVLFIPKKMLWKHFMPVFTACLAIELAILFVMAYVSKKISMLLIKPAKDMMESEKKFIANASHELKTPLSVIVANADMLANLIGQEKHLEYIKSESLRMNQLISQMLTLAKLDFVGEFYESSTFMLDEALLEVVYPFEGVAFEKSITITADIQENIPFTGDKKQIQQVASILLDNALDYSDTGGIIKVNACKKQNKCIVQVINSGKEIPPHIQNVLFDRFFRQDGHSATEKGHFGLGLSIAYEIVKKHHGTITVHSDNGMNCFTVTVPSKPTVRPRTASD